MNQVYIEDRTLDFLKKVEELKADGRISSNEELAKALKYKGASSITEISRKKQNIPPHKYTRFIQTYFPDISEAKPNDLFPPKKMDKDKLADHESREDWTIKEVRELLKSNRDLAAANKDLAAANLKLATDHGELVLIAKKAFGLSSDQKLSDNEEPREEVDGVKSSESKPIKEVIRIGAFQTSDKNAPEGNSKTKGKKDISSGA